jgi:hypothetical protein
MQNSESAQSDNTLHDFSNLNSKLKFTEKKRKQEVKIVRSYSYKPVWTTRI